MRFLNLFKVGKMCQSGESNSWQTEFAAIKNAKYFLLLWPSSTARSLNNIKRVPYQIVPHLSMKLALPSTVLRRDDDPKTIPETVDRIT